MSAKAEDLGKFLAETKTTFEDIKKTVTRIEKRACKLEEVYEAKIFHNSLDIFMIQRSCDQLIAVINRIMTKSAIQKGVNICERDDYFSEFLRERINKSIREKG